uniref:Uncharacterized protein n=1 Tax=Zooxanthella nutricula TaxID=1333877 RepID=A0A7S2M6K7_9DINO
MPAICSPCRVGGMRSADRDLERALEASRRAGRAEDLERKEIAAVIASSQEVQINDDEAIAIAIAMSAAESPEVLGGEVLGGCGAGSGAKSSVEPPSPSAPQDVRINDDEAMAMALAMSASQSPEAFLPSSGGGAGSKAKSRVEIPSPSAPPLQATQIYLDVAEDAEGDNGEQGEAVDAELHEVLAASRRLAAGQARGAGDAEDDAQLSAALAESRRVAFEQKQLEDELERQLQEALRASAEVVQTAAGVDGAAPEPAATLAAHDARLEDAGREVCARPGPMSAPARIQAVQHYTLFDDADVSADQGASGAAAAGQQEASDAPASDDEWVDPLDLWWASNSHPGVAAPAPGAADDGEIQGSPCGASDDGWDVIDEVPAPAA